MFDCKSLDPIEHFRAYSSRSRQVDLSLSDALRLFSFLGIFDLGSLCEGQQM